MKTRPPIIKYVIQLACLAVLEVGPRYLFPASRPVYIWALLLLVNGALLVWILRTVQHHIAPRNKD